MRSTVRTKILGAAAAVGLVVVVTVLTTDGETNETPPRTDVGEIDDGERRDGVDRIIDSEEDIVSEIRQQEEDQGG